MTHILQLYTALRDLIGPLGEILGGVIFGIALGIIGAIRRRKPSIKELFFKDITSWGDAVEHYESTYGLWDRNQIDRSLRRRINYRWTLDAYHQLLPEGLQDNRYFIKDDSWMEHEIISTVDLVLFLKKTCGIGEGTTNLHAGYDEMLDLVKTYSLPMRRGTISRGIEGFFLKVEEL